MPALIGNIARRRQWGLRSDANVVAFAVTSAFAQTNEKRSDLIREAVERELRRREKKG